MRLLRLCPPSLVRLALGMRSEICLRLEPLCAFSAVILPKSWKVFGGLGGLVLSKVLILVDVGMNLVEVARMTARLFLRV